MTSRTSHAPTARDLFGCPGTDTERREVIRRLAALAEFHAGAGQKKLARRYREEAFRLINAGQGSATA